MRKTSKSNNVDVCCSIQINTCAFIYRLFDNNHNNMWWQLNTLREAIHNHGRHLDYGRHFVCDITQKWQRISNYGPLEYATRCCHFRTICYEASCLGTDQEKVCILILSILLCINNITFAIIIADITSCLAEMTIYPFIHQPSHRMCDQIKYFHHKKNWNIRNSILLNDIFICNQWVNPHICSTNAQPEYIFTRWLECCIPNTNRIGFTKLSIEYYKKKTKTSNQFRRICSMIRVYQLLSLGVSIYYFLVDILI